MISCTCLIDRSWLSDEGIRLGEGSIVLCSINNEGMLAIKVETPTKGIAWYSYVLKD